MSDSGHHFKDFTVISQSLTLIQEAKICLNQVITRTHYGINDAITLRALGKKYTLEGKKMEVL